MQEFATQFAEESLKRVATEYVMPDTYENESYENHTLEQLLFEKILGNKYTINPGTGSTKPGGQAILYLCHDSSDINLEYVVKLYDKKAFPTPKNADNFYNMLNKLSSINSDYIVKILNYGSFSYENTEYIYGVTPKYSPFPEDKYSMDNRYQHDYESSFIELVRCFHRALCVLEENDIVHCDIKKSNIMWNDAKNCPVLIDFAGAIHHSADEKSAMVYATTAWNFPPEATTGQTANKFTDYYMLGIALREIIVGGRELEDKYYVSSKTVPTGLPNSLYFLLEGLLFSDRNGELYKNYRFDSKRLGEWIKKAENNGFAEENLSRYIHRGTFISLGENIAGSRESYGGKSFLGIEYPLVIERNNRPREYYSDADIAMDMYEDTEWGYNLIMNDAEIYFPDSPYIRKKSAELKALGNGKGQKNDRMDAVYVKFVLNSLEDKRLFFWPALKNVRSIEALGDELRKVLFAMRERGYNWDFPKTENESREIWKARKIKGLLSTDVLSFYFEINDKPELQKLVSDIEAAFRGNTAGSEDAVRALWKLAYSICENKIYRIDEKWYSDINGYYAAANKLFEAGDFQSLLQQRSMIIPDGKPEPGFEAWVEATRRSTV